MEEKSSEDQPPQENPAQVSENMERDEELSENSPAVGTENTESAGNAVTDEKPEPSPVQSESTSGLEIISRSTASYSGIQCEADAEGKKPALSVLPSGSTSGIEMISRSTTSASDIVCEEVETLDKEEKPEPSPLPSEPTLEIGSASEAQSEVSTIDTVDETEDRPIVSNATSASAIKSSFGKGFVAVKGFLSPPKSGKSKASRSKSMSPLKKNKSTDSNNSKAVSEDANVSSKGKESSKKGSGKESMFGKFNKTLNKIISGIKPSEKTSLIPNEKIDKTEEPKQSKPSKLDDLPEQISSNPWPSPLQWTDRSLSLTDRTSLGGTTTTDIQSTSSDADAFPSDSSGKPSEAGDDASEEVISGSLVGSPDADIQKNKDLATDEETKNEVAVQNSETQSTAEDGPSNEGNAQDEVNSENPEKNQPTEKDSESKDKD